VPDEENRRYPRWFVQGLIWGEFDCPDWCSCGQVHDAEEWCWSRLRARLERTGDLQSGSVGLVLDLERAMLALHASHPQAATMVLAQMFFEPAETGQLAEVFGPRSNPGRMIGRATAWLAAYMNGLPVNAPRGQSSCESAWRSAR